MNMNQNKLDDFLRQEVESSDFKMQEQDWLKMSAILDERDTKKRPGFWRWFSFLGIIILLGLGTYLLSMQKDDMKLEAHDKQQYSSGENSNSTNQNVTASKEMEVIKDESKQEDIGLLNNKTLEDQADKKPTSNKNSNTDKTISNTTNSTTNNTTNSTNTLSNSNQSTNAIAANDQSKHEETIPQQQQNASKNSKAENTLSVVTKSKKSKKQNISKKTTFTSTSTENPADVSSQETMQGNEAVLQSKKTNEGIQNRKAIDTNRYTVVRKQDGSMYNPRYVKGLENYEAVRLDSVTVIRYEAEKPITQTPSLPISQNAKEDDKTFEKRAFELYFLGGMYMNKAFKGNISNPVDWAFSPYVGIGIEKQFTKKLTMASHVGFTYFNGLNSQLSVTNYQYSFGLDSSTTTVTHKRLFQFYLPVNLYYQFMKNHSVFFGLGMCYQPDVYSKVSKTSMTSNAGFAGNVTRQLKENATSEFGYRSGFSNFDAFVQFGYSYNLFKNLMLQAAYQQGFIDNTKNSYFKNSTNNTQSRISIGLKYNFKRL